MNRLYNVAGKSVILYRYASNCAILIIFSDHWYKTEGVGHTEATYHFLLLTKCKQNAEFVRPPHQNRTGYHRLQDNETILDLSFYLANHI